MTAFAAVGADFWAGVAVLAWTAGWAFAVWWRERREALAFRKRMANLYRGPWER